MPGFRDHVDILRVLVFFLGIDLGFWALGFDRVFRWVARGGKRPLRPPEDVPQTEVDAVFSAVERANRLYYRSRLDCLPRALATYRFLRLRGIPAELCLGVKKYPFAGHAWVEYGGRVLDEIPARVPQYTLLKRLT